MVLVNLTERQAWLMATLLSSNGSSTPVSAERGLRSRFETAALEAAGERMNKERGV